jgi:hypothetical protein
MIAGPWVYFFTNSTDRWEIGQSIMGFATVFGAIGWLFVFVVGYYALSPDPAQSGPARHFLPWVAGIIAIYTVYYLLIDRAADKRRERQSQLA